MTFLITHKRRNVGGRRPRPTWPMPKNGPDPSDLSRQKAEINAQHLH